MKFSVHINQKAIIDQKLAINLIDAAILDVLYNFAVSPACERFIEEGILYCNLHPKVIRKQLPILEYAEDDTAYRRQIRLCKLGFFVAHKDNQKMKKSFYCITSLTAGLFSQQEPLPSNIVTPEQEAGNFSPKPENNPAQLTSGQNDSPTISLSVAGNLSGFPSKPEINPSEPEIFPNQAGNFSDNNNIDNKRINNSQQAARDVEVLRTINGESFTRRQIWDIWKNKYPENSSAREELIRRSKGKLKDFNQIAAGAAKYIVLDPTQDIRTKNGLSACLTWYIDRVVKGECPAYSSEKPAFDIESIPHHLRMNC